MAFQVHGLTLCVFYRKEFAPGALLQSSRANIPQVSITAAQSATAKSCLQTLPLPLSEASQNKNDIDASFFSCFPKMMSAYHFFEKQGLVR